MSEFFVFAFRSYSKALESCSSQTYSAEMSMELDLNFKIRI